MASQADDLQAVLTDASRTQFAAMAAVVTFWSECAESAASFSREMANELARLSIEDVSSDEVVSRMVEHSRQYLRRLTEHPNSAITRFNEEIEKIEEHRRSRTGEAAAKRKARAKS